ncbi:MAG: Ig-like domain-containing protein [Gemmatimonadales bacterium]
MAGRGSASRVLTGLLWLVVACSGGSDSGSPSGVASISLSATSATFAPGDTLRLSAMPRDGAGAAIVGQTITWSTSASSVAIVSVTGLVTAIATGSATITATASGKSASATITVALHAVASVSLSAISATFAPGDTLRLSAMPRDSAGAAIVGQTITWSTSASSVATVNVTGLVTAIANGTTTITAAAGGKSASAAIVIATNCATQNDAAAAMLIACIRQDSLWTRMVAFQAIADANPGADGHPSRNTFEPGYLASVNYVAGLMRAAGYRVTIQEYNPYPGSGIDYNLIADSPFGDTNHVVVADAHLDAIYGAGMLDNASGSTTILEIALNLARTPTRNQLRYIWFGGEEIGLVGSFNYLRALTPGQLAQVAFDIDADVTATPNYVIAIADPANSTTCSGSPSMYAASQRGNNYFISYFTAAGLPYERRSDDGTDSCAFAELGVPNTGILTGQDCCKSQAEVDLFGGFLGNYEGNIPSFDGGFVDRSHLWGDNLANNDPVVLTMISKAFASVVFNLANDPAIGSGSLRAVHH